MDSNPEDQAIAFSYIQPTHTGTTPSLFLVAIVPAIKLYELVGGKIRYHTTVERYYHVPINCAPMRFPSCPTQCLDCWLGIDGLRSHFDYLSQFTITTCFAVNWNGICALASNMQKYPWILVSKMISVDEQTKISMQLEQGPILLCTTLRGWSVCCMRYPPTHLYAKSRM